MKVSIKMTKVIYLSCPQISAPTRVNWPAHRFSGKPTDRQNERGSNTSADAANLRSRVGKDSNLKAVVDGYTPRWNLDSIKTFGLALLWPRFGYEFGGEFA